MMRGVTKAILCALGISGLVMGFLPCGIATAGEEAGAADSAGLRADIKASIESGLDWLLKQQNADGSFGEEEMNPALAGLAVVAITRSPVSDKYMKTPQFEKAVTFIVSCVKDDGGIYISDWAANYHTSIGLLALASVNDPKFAKQIEQTQNYIKDMQAGAEFQLESGDEDYSGGFVYRKGFRGADMSNTMMSLVALKESGLSADDEVWTRAIAFVERCQNTTVDGGFIYRPNESKAGQDERGNYRSYQSMTYAGLLSFIFANVAKDDARVRAAHEWIRAHWDLTENTPIGKQGLYYNYHTLAKALNAYAEKYLVDDEGLKHDWYRELAEILIKNQHKDGFWVNTEERWLETNKILVTCYSILALDEGYEGYR